MRILIADDNEMIRRGVKDILSSEPSWEVCGEATNGAEAVQKSRESIPDVILLDISMPGLGGLQSARLLRLEVPQAKILIISQHDPMQLSTRIMEAGADGFVDKSRLATDLLGCIKNLEAPSDTHQKSRER